MLADTPGLECPTPDGAFYVFPDCSKLIGARARDGRLIGDDEALVAYLLDEAHVATVPGSAFGRPGAFRISYAVDIDRLSEAAHRIQAAIARLDIG
jgi:aspartate aminotransferase